MEDRRSNEEPLHAGYQRGGYVLIGVGILLRTIAMWAAASSNPSLGEAMQRAWSGEGSAGKVVILSLIGDIGLMSLIVGGGLVLLSGAFDMVRSLKS